MESYRGRLMPSVLTAMLSAVLAAPAWAQDEDVDAIEPAVDTSRLSGEAYAIEPAVDTSRLSGETLDRAREDVLDDYEPAVDTSRLSDAAADSPGLAVDTSAATSGLAAAAEAGDDDVDAAALIARDVTRRESAGGVMDEIELGRTEITGNQELPKVLYIVPWQKSAPGDLMGRPVNTLIDEVLAPVDREEFLRQVDYYGDLYGENEE